MALGPRDTNMREVVLAITGVILVVTIIVTASLYNGREKRKAYYACLELSHKISQEQAASKDIRFITLPSCTL